MLICSLTSILMSSGVQISGFAKLQMFAMTRSGRPSCVLATILKGFLHGIHSFVLPFKQVRFDLDVSLGRVPCVLSWCSSACTFLNDSMRSCFGQESNDFKPGGMVRITSVVKRKHAEFFDDDGHLLGRAPKDIGESQPLHFDCVHTQWIGRRPWLSAMLSPL